MSAPEDVMFEASIISIDESLHLKFEGSITNGGFTIKFSQRLVFGRVSSGEVVKLVKAQA